MYEGTCLKFSLSAFVLGKRGLKNGSYLFNSLLEAITITKLHVRAICHKIMLIGKQINEWNVKGKGRLLITAITCRLTGLVGNEA